MVDLSGVFKDDEFTELVDADIPRVDLVDKAANGMRFLIAKQADGSRGLMDPSFVRGLIGKPEPEPVAKQDGEMVTMSGSPAAIAKFIHQAAQRADPVAKAQMSAADQNGLPDSVFAYIEPGGHQDESGRTTPRSLRHFPINDEAHVRNALSRAPQSPFGDKAMPAIRRAAKKFGIEVSKEMDVADEDLLDASVTLAEPDGDTAAGMPTDPGSPAWEAIDAATARKWTAILARAKGAIDLLADREMLEAAAGDDGDAMQACDLQDACCAIDYAISVLAPFAVAEQADADCCDDMTMVGKALAGWDPAPLDTIESLAPVRKAGRVLSSANEAAIRDAVDKLQKVLASLPAAPVEKTGAPVVTTPEEPDMSTADLPTPQASAETVADAGEQPKMGVAKTGEPVAKADGEGKAAMRAVYDAKGHLVGIVDPADITPIEDATPEPDAEAAPETADMQPAPAAEVGTPADAVPDGVAKQVTDNPTDTNADAIAKSIADVVKAQLDAHSAAQQEVLAKMAGDLAAAAETVEVLKGQVQALEEQPAQPKVFTNGAVPPAHQMRGQDRGATPVDVAKAAELKQVLYKGTAPEQNQAAVDMQTLAIAKLQEIQQRR